MGGGLWFVYSGVFLAYLPCMTEAEHNQRILKFIGNRPLASATEVFGETINLAIYLKISLELCVSPYS